MGRTVSFENAVLLYKTGVGYGRSCEEAQQALEKTFAPELLREITDILVLQ